MANLLTIRIKGGSKCGYTVMLSSPVLPWLPSGPPFRLYTLIFSRLSRVSSRQPKVLFRELRWVKWMKGEEGNLALLDLLFLFMNVAALMTL